MAEGAEGETKAEFDALLENDMLSTRIHQLTESLSKVSGNTKLSIADSVWLDDQFEADASWLSRMVSFYEAEIYESNARRVYEETYEGFLNEVEKIMDVNPIRNFIVEKSKSFKDIMRNEVNRKISLGSQEMLRIMDDETLSLEEYEKKLNSYVDTVCDNARKKLLDKIQEAVNETNEYIRANANAFLNNELEFVKEQNNTLKELSKQGAARDAQILTIAEQRATLQMINSIANEIS